MQTSADQLADGYSITHIVSMSTLRVLRVTNLTPKIMPYAEGLALQERLVDQRKQNQIPDSLLLLQEIERRGIHIHVTPRGGQVTYHGPGQLVAYPIIALRAARLGARAYVEALEDTVVDALLPFGIVAHARVAGATGVWVCDRKIAAIGVRVSHGVSSHGVALNITTDLDQYNMIVPCGIDDKAVTSVGAELPASNAMANYKHVLSAFVTAFAKRLNYASVEHLA